MREKIKEFFDVRENIKSDGLRMICALFPIFSVVLAYPVYNALEKREYLWGFSMDILEFVGSRASIVIIMVVIWGILVLTIYPIFILLDKKNRRKRKKR